MIDRRLVLVVQDELIRAGIQTLIEEEDQNISLTTYYDLEHLQQSLEDFSLPSFDVIIIDDNSATPIQIFEWLSYFETHFPTSKIIILSERICIPYIHKIISMGVVSYIHKQEIGLCLNVFLRALETDKHHILSPVLSPMITEIVQNMVNERRLDLNRSDLELLRLLAQGLTLKEIALELKLNYQTVCRRRRKIRQILDVNNNDQIIDAARRQGLII
jgi:DNA-binding NarL/FixJ family response regulator